MRTMRDLVWLTQLGMSVISPLLVFTLGSVWLQNHFSLGKWVVIVGVLLGLSGSVSAGVSFARHTKNMDSSGKDQPPVSFNEHT